MRKRKPSPAQIAASQRNGARSRGPLTPQTKAISARNATTHGLTANTILLVGESRDRFEALQNQLLDHLQPQSILELTAVEEMVVAIWKQRRAWALETASLQEAARQITDRPGLDDHPHRAVKAWRHLHKRGHDFPNLLLQQIRVNQQLDRAYRRFRQYAALRQENSPEGAEPGELFTSEHQNPDQNTPQTPQVVGPTCDRKEV